MTPSQQRRIGRATYLCTASDFIFWLQDLPRITRVVLYGRASTRAQASGENLRDQMARLRREVEKLGFRVVGVFDEIGSGWRDDLMRRESAARCAQEHGAILVAESTSRFIRSIWWTTQKQTEQPSDQDYLSLCRALEVKLATLEHPDAPDRPIQTLRGMEEKNARAGRPRKVFPGSKKIRREELVQKARELRRSGLGYRQIAVRLRVPLSTVYGWLVG